MSTAPLAFVAGASGYTGRSVVAELRARGVETVAHVRPDAARLAEWRARFERLGARVDTTPWDGAAMTATFRVLGPTHVFATVGTTLARALRGSDSAIRDSYEAVDLGLTRILIDASRAASTVERFLFVSAAGARPGTRNPYLKVRVEIEGLIRASGLAYTIARPAYVTGPDRDEARPLERLGAITSDVGLALLGAIGARAFKARYRSIRGEVLARGLVRAAFDPASAGRSLHAGELRVP